MLLAFIAVTHFHFRIAWLFIFSIVYICQYSETAACPHYYDKANRFKSFFSFLEMALQYAYISDE